ncbi:MAG: hypothetical protein JWM68_3761 [Verrucomicrobiales bacterium]|nr:hypothetical protein [Verrucomicrobiales bacterium]
MSTNNKPEFKEELQTKHPEPTESRTVEFNFGEIYKNVDAEVTPENLEIEYKRLCQAIRSMLDWIIPKDMTGEKAVRLAGRRVIALAWVTDPEQFSSGNSKEEKGSGTKVGNTYGMHKAVFSEFTSDCSKHFRIRNKFQSHGWNFKPEETNESNTDSDSN